MNSNNNQNIYEQNNFINWKQNMICELSLYKVSTCFECNKNLNDDLKIVLGFQLSEIPISLRLTSPTSHRRSWHGPPLPLCFSNFLFSNLFSIKFLYFFIISSLFPYFNLFVSIFIQSYVNIKLHVSTLYRY